MGSRHGLSTRRATLALASVLAMIGTTFAVVLPPHASADTLEPGDPAPVAHAEAKECVGDISGNTVYMVSYILGVTDWNGWDSGGDLNAVLVKDGVDLDTQTLPVTGMGEVGGGFSLLEEPGPYEVRLELVYEFTVPEVLTLSVDAGPCIYSSPRTDDYTAEIDCAGPGIEDDSITFTNVSEELILLTWGLTYEEVTHGVAIPEGRIAYLDPGDSHVLAPIVREGVRQEEILWGMTPNYPGDLGSDTVVWADECVDPSVEIAVPTGEPQCGGFLYVSGRNLGEGTYTWTVRGFEQPVTAFTDDFDIVFDTDGMYADWSLDLVSERLTETYSGEIGLACTDAPSVPDRPVLKVTPLDAPCSGESGKLRITNTGGATADMIYAPEYAGGAPASLISVSAGQTLDVPVNHVPRYGVQVNLHLSTATGLTDVDGSPFTVPPGCPLQPWVGIGEVTCTSIEVFNITSTPVDVYLGSVTDDPVIEDLIGPPQAIAADFAQGKETVFIVDPVGYERRELTKVVPEPQGCDAPSPDPGPVAPSAVRCFAVKGSPGAAAIVNLTPVLAMGAGDGKLVSSDARVNPPVASNVNFGPGTVDPNVAVAKIGVDGEVCFVNSRHSSVHLVADHLGTIAESAYTPAKASGAPDRRVDTRRGIGGGKVPPSGRQCFSVSGSRGDAAIVNLTPVLADGVGDGQLVSSDVRNPPVASNVNFGPGSVDPNVAVARIGADGKVCFVNSVHTSVHLVADHLGTIAKSAYTPAKASGSPDRRVDTRKGVGGGKIGPSGRRCFSVSGSPGDAALVNLTPVLAEGFGDGQLVSSDVRNPPVASNVNFGPGSVDPNVSIVPIGDDGKVCFVNSTHTSVHLVADHLGTISKLAYTPATPSGAPDRRVDTRK